MSKSIKKFLSLLVALSLLATPVFAAEWQSEWNRTLAAARKELSLIHI